MPASEVGAGNGVGVQVPLGARKKNPLASMVELADTLVSKISAGNGVWVQVPLEARSLCSSKSTATIKLLGPHHLAA